LIEKSFIVSVSAVKKLTGGTKNRKGGLAGEALPYKEQPMKRDKNFVFWLKYRLATNGYRLRDIAEKTNYCPSMVSRVIRGSKTSPRIDSALARTLGYSSFDALAYDFLIEASRREGGAA
jgi:hypothetical protein